MDSGWWAVLVAGLAAAVAAWQAWEARRARSDARRARDAAGAHEAAALDAARDAAGAAERGAKAQERIATVVESQSEQDTWRKTKKTSELWRISNVSGHEVQYVNFDTDDERLQVIGDTGDGFESLGPREHFDVLIEWKIRQKQFAALQVFWMSAANEQKRKSFTFENRPPPEINLF